VAGRYRVVGDSDQWTAAVAGTEVTLSGVDGAFLVGIDAGGRATIDGPDGRFEGVAARAGDRVWVSIDGQVFAWTVTEGTRRPAAAALDQDALAAPMAATVVRINVAPGAAVQDGDLLVALEAMKMELPIRAPRDGVVAAVHCREGELVQQGAVLVELEQI
jgi:biotin carboxyl carrier protein